MTVPERVKMMKEQMKTSVELKRDKVELAKRLGNVSTLKELLDRSLDAFIAQSRRHSMAQLLGKRFFEGDLNDLSNCRF